MGLALATEITLADDHHDPADRFLEGPLFKKARPPQIYLETYDSAWRAGAQAIGYREAAEMLIDVVIKRRARTSKTLLHPILFLYRHSVELRLKRLLEEYGGDGAPNRHELDKLWPACKEVITRYLPETDFEKVDRLIAELHAVDPDSQTFRYAKTRKGDPIVIKFSEVDLVHFRKQMDDLDTFFFGLDAEITEVQGFLADTRFE